MRLVLDASVAVAAARSHEASHAAARARVVRALSGKDDVVVPSIFPIEVGSALARVGEPTGAIRAYVNALLAVVEVTTIGPRSARQILDIAMSSKLRAADAVFVWLAARRSVPVCTLDQEMAARGAAFCAGQLLTAFKKEVKPIGESEVLRGPEPHLALSELVGTGGLIAVELGDGPPVLVRIRLDAYRNGGRPVLNAMGFVSAEMREAAVARALSVQPRGIQTVPVEMVRGLSSTPPPDAARLAKPE